MQVLEAYKNQSYQKKIIINKHSDYWDLKTQMH